MTPIHISNSEIQTFKDCRRKWMLAYYLRLTTPGAETPYGNRWIGTLCHTGLQHYYTKAHEGVAAAHTEAYQQMINQQEQAIIAAELEDGSPEYGQAMKAIELAMIMVEGYFEWVAEEGADANLRVVAVEQELECLVRHGDGVARPPVYIVGKADLIVEDVLSGHHFALDHKTAGTMPTTWPYRDQLMTYSWLHMQDIKDDTTWVGGGIMNVLRRVSRSSRSKPPYYGRTEARFNQLEIMSFESAITGVVHDILKTRLWLDTEGLIPETDAFYATSAFRAYPTYSDTCSWKCEFVQHCEMLTDGSRVAQALRDEYVKRAPGPGERYVNLPSLKGISV